LNFQQKKKFNESGLEISFLDKFGEGGKKQI
jgi:hypothetical protein